MVSLLARLAPKTWLRAPRRTARLRLTVLYGTLFLLSGAVLLTVTYVLAVRATEIQLPITVHAHTHLVHPPSQQAISLGQMAQWQAQITHLHDAAMHRLLIGSGLALAVMALISIALGWLVAGRVLAPVRTINAAARRISASNLHDRLALDGPNDEFRELAATLDDLLGRLQASFDFQRRFVANASHELRTPLTLDRALLERALRKSRPTEADWRMTCERLLASSQQQHGLIEALLTLARSEGAPDRHERCELESVVESVLLSPELDTEPRLHTQAHLRPAPVNGDPRLLERLTRNLIDNAIRHNIPGGDVEVTTELREGHAVLTVTNTGPLVPADDIERLLRPFQRAGADRTAGGDGLGLGLSIVRAIATTHHATLTLTPQPNGGLRIEVSFPEVTTATAPVAAVESPGNHQPLHENASRRTIWSPMQPGGHRDADT
jgi:signal transduction histidine kinase